MALSCSYGLRFRGNGRICSKGRADGGVDDGDIAFKFSEENPNEGVVEAASGEIGPDISSGDSNEWATEGAIGRVPRTMSCSEDESFSMGFGENHTGVSMAKMADGLVIGEARVEAITETLSFSGAKVDRGWEDVIEFLGEEASQSEKEQRSPSTK
ncbi:unnamed protein product [Ilex paraguariensis]|uniref:Uncharacterized protein n=1 Tax=Ilex paraguariensis TaxID=185542 RepID=A0ABC8R876_9AQUA